MKSTYEHLQSMFPGQLGINVKQLAALLLCEAKSIQNKGSRFEIKSQRLVGHKIYWLKDVAAFIDGDEVEVITEVEKRKAGRPPKIKATALEAGV
jgi:hypothetical protein